MRRETRTYTSWLILLWGWNRNILQSLQFAHPGACSHLAHRDGGNGDVPKSPTAPNNEVRDKTVEKKIEEMMASLGGLNELLTLVESLITSMRRSNESEVWEKNMETRAEQTIRIASENPAHSEVLELSTLRKRKQHEKSPKARAEESTEKNRGRFTSYAHTASVHCPGPELFPETVRTGVTNLKAALGGHLRTPIHQLLSHCTSQDWSEWMK